jgi:hypothetical protein
LLAFPIFQKWCIPICIKLYFNLSHWFLRIGLFNRNITRDLLSLYCRFCTNFHLSSWLKKLLFIMLAYLILSLLNWYQIDLVKIYFKDYGFYFIYFRVTEVIEVIVILINCIWIPDIINNMINSLCLRIDSFCFNSDIGWGNHPRKLLGPSSICRGVSCGRIRRCETLRSVSKWLNLVYDILILFGIIGLFLFLRLRGGNRSIVNDCVFTLGWCKLGVDAMIYEVVTQENALI